jgi:hypothetical protein
VRRRLIKTVKNPMYEGDFGEFRQKQSESPMAFFAKHGLMPADGTLQSEEEQLKDYLEGTKNLSEHLQDDPDDRTQFEI